MNLYQINEKIMTAFDRAIDAETGEILDAAAFEELDNLQLMREEKIEGILLWIKNLTAAEEELKKEKQAFEERMKQKRRKAESLKQYVSNVLAGQKFETTQVTVTWRKSEVTEFHGDIALLPEECITRREPEVNKTALKKLLKAGAEIPGAQIVSKQNMSIK